MLVARVERLAKPAGQLGVQFVTSLQLVDRDLLFTGLGAMAESLLDSEQYQVRLDLGADGIIWHRTEQGAPVADRDNPAFVCMCAVHYSSWIGTGCLVRWKLHERVVHWASRPAVVTSVTTLLMQVATKVSNVLNARWRDYHRALAFETLEPMCFSHTAHAPNYDVPVKPPTAKSRRLLDDV